MYTRTSLLESIWKLNDYDERQSLIISQRHNISPLISKLLNIRNIPENEIDKFLNPELQDYLPDPFELKDMNKSINRIIDTISKKGLIGIIADYDVDGSTSAAILCRFFKFIGQRYILKIPNRLKNGYGPNEEILDNMLDNKIDLLLTLDCGTTYFDILDKKKYLIFDTIVIDHHISDKHLPKVFSVINPNRFDEDNKYKDLAAVGVTFLFILGLRKVLRIKNFFKKNNILEPNLLNYLDLVALGTVCDVVNLQHYNRAFVSKGIEIIHKRKNKGITAIIDNSRINHSPTVTDLGYIIGPQLNAASRIDDSSLSSRLLMSEDIIEIESISRKILILNEKRKLIEKKIFDEAIEQAIKQKNKKIIIVKGELWHKGVLGIIASRLVERFNKPAIVISYNKDEGVGSARSLNFIDLGHIIIYAKEKGLLLEGGGHKMAAGLKISMQKYNDFLKFIVDILKNIDSSFFKKTLHFDSILTLDEINLDLLDNIEKLQPCGISNPNPKFIVQNINIEFSKIIKEKHVLMKFRNNKDNLLNGISFNCVDNALGQNLLNNKHRKFDLGCSIIKDRYQRNYQPQLVIHDAIIIN